jgi:hypothetical protein
MTEEAKQRSDFFEDGVLPALKSLYESSELPQIGSWIPAGEGKGSFWSLPVSEHASERLLHLSRNAEGFWSGEVSIETLAKALEEALTP